jgi:hypothetical protein
LPPPGHHRATPGRPTPGLATHFLAPFGLGGTGIPLRVIDDRRKHRVEEPEEASELRKKTQTSASITITNQNQNTN